MEALNPATSQPNTHKSSAVRAFARHVIRLSAPARYGIAVGAAIVAVLFRLAFDPVWGVKLPYITLFPAIMVSAWLGGLWPGVLTTLITGTAAEYFWIEPSYSWQVGNVSELLGIAVFLGVGIVISVLNEAWRRGAAAVSESEERLRVTLTSIGAAVVTTDAALREAERARRVAETAAKQLSVALEAGRMGTWEYTIRTGAVKWSAGLEAIHGLKPGEFPGTFEAFRNEIHPDDRDRVLDAIRQAADARRDHHVEYRIVRTDGSVRWVEGRGQLLLDDAQQPDRMVGICLDVTERRQAEERFRMAIEAAPTAMIMVNRDGTVVLANALTEQLLGYRRDEIVGAHVDQFVPLPFRAQHSEHRRSFFVEARRRPMGAGRDLRALRKDGSEVPVEIGLSPIEMADGLFVLAAVTDITERKDIEERRAQLLVREQTARAEIERASQLKDEFLAMLSHELRTPLNAVLGYANLLNSGGLTEERTRHAIQAIQRNAQAQARLVESLLDLSRVMAGKLELDLERVALPQIVEAAVDVIRPEADAKGIGLEVDVPASELALVGDAGRLQQVFWNLLSNAVKFTPRDGRISIRMTRNDSQARVEITDTGQGITPDFLPYVFDRFKQAQARKRRSPAGLGLGLALVREMVQAHGGTVTADSRGDGQGSTFTVNLPLSVTSPEVESGGAGTVRAERTPDARSRKEVLIVDDDGDKREQEV